MTNASCGYCGETASEIVAIDYEGRAICADCDADYFPAYTQGFFTALYEIQDQAASHHGAEIRGLFPGEPDAMQRWDHGYLRAIMLYRLGFSLEVLQEQGDAVLEVGVDELALRLLDGTWPLETRPDPRNLRGVAPIEMPQEQASCDALPAEGSNPSSTPNESYYDAHIAPLMTKLAMACNTKGLPFVCAVELTEDRATTPENEGRRTYAMSQSFPAHTSSRLTMASKLLAHGIVAMPQVSSAPHPAAKLVGPWGPFGPMPRGMA